MSMNTLGKNFRVCATCSRWCGSRRPNGTRSCVEYEQNQKGECAGGGFNHLKMAPMSTCNKYQKWL